MHPATGQMTAPCPGSLLKAFHIQITIENKKGEKSMNPEPHSLQMEKLVNARDLAGYRSSDGRSVVSGLLLRTAALADASDRDLARLVSEYGVRTVIDLRSEDEVLQKPDPRPEGVKYVHITIMDESLFEDNKDAIERTEPPGLKEMADGLLKIAAENDMSGFYAMMLQSPVGKEGFRRFFREVLDAEDGAVLWHCSAGKDRTGLCAALLLAALGVDTATILEDYLLTNEYCSERRDALQAELEKAGYTKEQALTVAGIMEGVDELLLQTAFASIEKSDGSLEGYLRNQIGLTDTDFSVLRSRYLV